MLRELGIGATLFGLLARGLLSGSTPIGPKDVRAHLLRFSGEAGKENAVLVDKLRAFAAQVARTPAQVCLAWVLAQEPTFVPIAGARTPAQLDLLDAVDRPLSAGRAGLLRPSGARRTLDTRVRVIILPPLRQKHVFIRTLGAMEAARCFACSMRSRGIG